MLFEIQWSNETLLYNNISLILFSKGAHSLLLVWEIDGETYTQRRNFFLSRIFFWEPGCAIACASLKAISSDDLTPLIGFMSLAWLPILWPLSKSDCVVLISHGLLPLTHLLGYPDTLQSPCLLITTWQLVKAHGVTRNELKIHVICYITIITWNTF